MSTILIISSISLYVTCNKIPDVRNNLQGRNETLIRINYDEPRSLLELGQGQNSYEYVFLQDARIDYVLTEEIEGWSNLLK